MTPTNPPFAFGQCSIAHIAETILTSGFVLHQFQDRCSVAEETLKRKEDNCTDLLRERESLENQLNNERLSVERALKEADKLDVQLDEVCQYIQRHFLYP